MWQFDSAQVCEKIGCTSFASEGDEPQPELPLEDEVDDAVDELVVAPPAPPVPLVLLVVDVVDELVAPPVEVVELVVVAAVPPVPVVLDLLEQAAAPNVVSAATKQSEESLQFMVSHHTSTRDQGDRIAAVPTPS